MGTALGLLAVWFGSDSDQNPQILEVWNPKPYLAVRNPWICGPTADCRFNIPTVHMVTVCVKNAPSETWNALRGELWVPDATLSRLGPSLYMCGR